MKPSRCCCLESELLQLWQQDFVLAGLEQDIDFISAVTNLSAAGTSPEWVSLSSLALVFAVTLRPACSEQVLQGMEQGIGFLLS